MSTWYIDNSSADEAKQIPYLEDFPDVLKLDDYPKLTWQLKTGEKTPSRPVFPEIHEIDDAPSTVWVLDANSECPYRVMFPKMYNYLYEPPDPIYQPSYICVYDMHNAFDAFDNNGLAILCPTKCEITEELNGMYELELEHPFDSEGRWKHLLELNIIKANGQLFRIYSKQTTMSSDGVKVRTVKARHIFYDLNDKLLLDVRPENKDGYHFIEWIMTHMYDDDPDGYYPVYEYEYYSDIEDTGTAYYIGTSVTGALLGEDNCFINRIGGEIHRDNFYFSINKSKETASENSFDIKYGVDMIDIEETIDYSDVITQLRAKDNFGNTWEVFYTPTMRLHHNVSRSIILDYEEENAPQFHQDADNYFRMYCQPSINYKVTFADLRNCELYKDFIGLQKCLVGDTGTIYCEELGISTTQKIVKKTVDVLTQSTVSVELGNLTSSLTRRDKYAGTLRINNSADKAAAAAAEEARKAIVNGIKVWRDAYPYKYKEVKGIWQELYKTKEETE